MNTDDQDRPPSAKRAKLDVANEILQGSLCEIDVGICEYMSAENAGFKGVLKSRWEDFLVREVDLSGNVCKLTSLVPGEKSINTESSNPEPSYIIPIEIDEILKEIERETMSEASFPASEDKSEREMFHKAIRTNYPSLMSKTTEVDGNRFINVTKGALVRGEKAWERVANVCDPPKETPFCHFVLYKEGKDTMQVLHVIGRMLKINSKAFGFAGTKDRRAITTQKVSIRNISARRLSTLNPRLGGIKLGNFSYSADTIRMGDLYGNRFSIVIRDIVAEDSVIHKAIADWERRGFINYFGLQRFGHCSEARTFDIGKEIIRCNWERAIDLILTPSSADLPVVRLIKERYSKTHDAKACGDDMPQCLEKTLLLGVARFGKTAAALQTLPRNLRHLYAHSYQSLVWNKVASRRIRELGVGEDSKALVGDLYFPDIPSVCKPLRSVDSSSELYMDDSLNPSTVAVPDAVHAKESTDADGAEGDLDDDADAVLAAAEALAEAAGTSSSRVPATPSRVTEGGERPSIRQVVLPIPGYDVVFPDNASGTWYEEFLREDSITLENLNHKVKDFALRGSYRHLVVKPENVHYEIREYTDSHEPLVLSDYAIMAKEDKTSNKNGSTSSEAKTKASGDDGKIERHRALVIEFTLPKAAYATMAIRELMKDVTVMQ